MNIPRIQLRRFSHTVWENILSHAQSFELEIDEPSIVGTVLNILRRYQRDHVDAFYVVTIEHPCLLRIDMQAEQPTNPLTGKPCAIRLDAATPVDEVGVVEELAQVTNSFAESMTHSAFRSWLRQQFEAHVLKHRRQLRRLGLDHPAMCALARGMFEKSVQGLEQQVVRALTREGGLAVDG